MKLINNLCPSQPTKMILYFTMACFLRGCESFGGCVWKQDSSLSEGWEWIRSPAQLLRGPQEHGVGSVRAVCGFGRNSVFCAQISDVSFAWFPICVRWTFLHLHAKCWKLKRKSIGFDPYTGATLLQPVNESSSTGCLAVWVRWKINLSKSLQWHREKICQSFRADFLESLYYNM